MILSSILHKHKNATGRNYKWFILKIISNTVLSLFIVIRDRCLSWHNSTGLISVEQMNTGTVEFPVSKFSNIFCIFMLKQRKELQVIVAEFLLSGKVTHI